MSARGALFAAGAGVAGWVLGGYPAALALAPRRPWRAGGGQPLTITVIVPAFRERDALRDKLDGMAHGTWPLERLQVIVAVDEDEGTAAVAREHPLGAEVTFAAQRGGKAAALNRALELATGDVVVLTDANNVLMPGALDAAARHFADPSVWGVAGRRGERGSAYDRYEDLLRRLETRGGSVAAASGEFIAVRRERLPRFAAGVVNDDLWLLCHLVRAGGRVVYEPDAASVEDALELRAELARRTRMGAGRVMLAGELRGLPPSFVVKLLSHKGGRLALPFALLAALAGSLSLAKSSRAQRRLAAAQVTAYGLGAASAAGLRAPGPAGKLLRALGQFTVGNYATAAGVVRALRGAQDHVWEPVR